MLIRDRMSSPAITIDVKASIAEARALMRHYDIRRLPVLQKDRLVGIVTQTDLMQALPSPASTLAAWEWPGLLRKASVQEIMTEDPITIGPDAPIEAAAFIMRGQKIGGLPVVEDQTLVGVITESDIFEAFLDLTGLRQGGARLVVDLRDRSNAVGQVATVVEAAGVTLTSIATYRQGGRRLAVLRIDAQYPLHLVQSLNETGFPVLHFAAAPGASNGRAGHSQTSVPRSRT